MTHDNEAIKSAKNRAYRFVEAQQQALDSGVISEAQWFERYTHFFTAAYLAADDPRAQSGHDGDEARYRYGRMMILEAIHKSGTFLDVGCANGYLIESLDRWLSGSSLTLEFFGLDISEGLLNLAKQRLPHWRDRFFLGNALSWKPPQRYDFVYLCGLELVPLQRQQELLTRLLHEFVATDGCLIFGPVSEERDSQEFEEQVAAWGLKPSGYCEKSHQEHEILARKMFWFNKLSGG
jgi:SAM-dependent methyltransferase